ncbi:SNARE complex subunit [Coccidioides immitis RS]|uniref:SNARE complex subunit n=3 Tax=Coccidioides immitis TaxID=5501 RepID=A0A0E1RY31_COCIM|nr:SNARE complex subunit [Coccidioides immitis RS]EAS34946.1 SNARE complex subunit [Coccidioides immitis RS]KMP00141.1 hypothetical protein CIRG_00283 [Coccidioides immitis RMSCC 2394]KMU84321.1 v-SNARE [Coccidioides immitis H538.4]TPX26754.1 hypothetical protein DIZ76_012216 [Coccidioides immitis]
MSNPGQLFLLADHVKLSLLERQRAISLSLEPNSQDGEISRSLESLRDGIESVEKEARRLEEDGDSSFVDLKEEASNLRQQLHDLESQFYENPSSSSKDTISSPNDPSLAEDFVKASSASASTTLKHPTPQHPVSKSVRFTDTLTAQAEEEEDPNRRELLQPYRDSPSPSLDHSQLSNEEIHAHHAQIMQEQDDQLDRLGESIGRQHQLSIQIGDELEGQVALLDEVDGHVDRHIGRLDGARRRLGKFKRNARESRGIMWIIGLIILLVILIVILK